jgi:voltage-gated potassium channel
MSIKHRISEILEPESQGDIYCRGFNIFIIALIILNVFAVALETVQGISENYSQSFKIFEFFSMLVFSLEYVLRIWTAVVKEEYWHPVTGRLRYMVTPAAIIDMIVILPFYLPLFLNVDLRFLRVLRLLRLFALFKMARYSHSMHLLRGVLKDVREELLIVLGIIIGMLFFASGMIYLFEHQAQPEKFSSIFAAMWWAVSTMTTVGYGDVYPITTLGKIFGGFISILGLGTFGLPVGIIAYGFIETLQKQKSRPVVCSHCGEIVDAPIERRQKRH